MALAPTHVRYAVDGPIATLTFDRAEARNAWSEPMLAQTIAALDRAAADPAIRVVVVTGTGPAFHAGGDRKAMQERSGMFAGDAAELRERYRAGIQSVPRRIAGFDKPLIAAINGPAIGAGLDIACMCDLRLAAKGATMGSTFVTIGLVPGDGGAFFLARAIGLPRALELMLTGRLVDADEALRLGLVHEVVAPDDLLPAAYRLAHRIAKHPPLAVQMTKRAAYRAWPGDMDAALELAATYQGIAQNAPEHRQALGS